MGTGDTAIVTNEEDKTSDSETKISDLESKIIRQVEYYFGDYNLCRDNFLKNQVQTNDGWVPLETMVKFNRLKMLSEDCSVIASALRKSTNELLEVNEAGTDIRRSVLKPLPDNSQETRVERDTRTIYAKGFRADCSLDELIEYFKQHGRAENIQMRRLKTGKKKFKGSVFVTFQTEEEAKKFLEKKPVEYKGTALLREAKPAYLARKNTEFEERLKFIKEKKQKRLENDKGEEKSDKNESEKKDNDDETNSKELSDEGITRGCLMKLTGLAEKTMREDLKDLLDPHGTVSYVDYSKGEPEAVIRFESPVASEVLEKVSKEVDGVIKIEICGADATAVVIEGDEEVEYIRNIKRKSQRFKNNRRGGHQNRGRGRGGRGYGRGHSNQRNKRKFDDDDDGDRSSRKEFSKKVKAEEQESAKTVITTEEVPVKKEKRPAEATEQEPPKKMVKVQNTEE